MLPIRDEFEYEFGGTDLVYGRGCIAKLGSKLREYGFERALIVTGTNVGANAAVMDPVVTGVGTETSAVFDETTPAKRLETVFDAIEHMERESADVLVGVGGGSSLDIARQASVVAADGRSPTELREAARAGRLSSLDPQAPMTPVVVVPTTFAGADLSSGGSIEVLSDTESPTGQPVRISGSNRPEAIFYDPDLFETTPFDVLAGSAMNGFNKGIETTYARNGTPITDSTAVQGLRQLQAGLPRLPDDPAAMERAVVGLILVQFERRLSVIHAFGHGFSYRYDLQQGDVHAIVGPHVLRHLFETVDANRAVLAAGLGIAVDDLSDDEIAASIVAEVAAVRDALGLPKRLRDLDPVRETDLPDVALAIVEDPLLDSAPVDFDPTVEDVEAVLRKAW